MNVVNSKAISGEQAARMTGILGTNIFLVDPAAVAERLRQSPFDQERDGRDDGCRAR